MRAALRDPDGNMRVKAALGDIGPEAKPALPVLRRIAKDSPEESLRDRAANAVKKIETSAPKPKGRS
jgi:hypothetical protein